MFCNKSILPGQSLAVGIDYTLQFNIPVQPVKKTGGDINKDINISVTHYAHQGNALISAWYRRPESTSDIWIAVRLINRVENDCPVYIRLEGWWK